jgi:hypothetical protein
MHVHPLVVHAETSRKECDIARHKVYATLRVQVTRA